MGGGTEPYILYIIRVWVRVFKIQQDKNPQQPITAPHGAKDAHLILRQRSQLCFQLCFAMFSAVEHSLSNSQILLLTKQI
jgi:hypothetical protein